MTQQQKETVNKLMQRHGQSYAGEIGIRLDAHSPSGLFQLLVAATLLSARIRAEAAVEAAKALFGKGWTTPDKMKDTTWAQRVKVLNENGYARYDESTSRMLGETLDILMTEYGGDLRRLREAADTDPAAMRRRLKAFKGIGDVGVDIFFREVQGVWAELYPFVDSRALKAAGKLGLPTEPEKLAALVPKADLPRLLGALIRTDLADDYEAVKAA